MPTVTVRFEKCRKVPSRGAVYYRIYKGHNTRMEFTSHLRMSVSMWDNERKTVKGHSPKAIRMRKQIAADMALLSTIIEEDAQRHLSMMDIKTAFRQRRTILYNEKEK